MTTFTSSELQGKTQDNPANVTLTDVPAADELLFILGACRSASSYTVGDQVGDPGGIWTGDGTLAHVAGSDNTDMGSSSRCHLNLFAMLCPGTGVNKIAGYDINETCSALMWIVSPVSGSYDLTFQQAAFGGSGTSSTPTVTTGTTGSVSGGGGDLLVADIAVWRREGSNSFGRPVAGAFFDPAPDLEVCVDLDGGDAVGSHEMFMAIGLRFEQSDGAFSTTVDWTGTGHEMVCGTVVFSNGALSGGGTTTNWYNQAQQGVI